MVDKRISQGLVSLATASLVVVGGCGGRPGRVHMADIDASDAARQAMVAYDTNGDGKLSDEELESVPGIQKWRQLYDLDSDHFVSETEIQQRLEKWQDDKLAFRAISASVQLDGRAVSGVRVELIPEPYLGAAAKPATGMTNALGYASLSVAPDDLPEAIKQRGIQVSGVYPGTYKITVSHPSHKLPNTSREGVPLGDEIAIDTIDSSIKIELSSR